MLQHVLKWLVVFSAYDLMNSRCVMTLLPVPLTLYSSHLVDDIRVKVYWSRLLLMCQTTLWTARAEQRITTLAPTGLYDGSIANVALRELNIILQIHEMYLPLEVSGTRLHGSWSGCHSA